MADDESWTVKRVAAARKERDLVTETVAKKVEKLLAGPLQQPHSPTELARIASALLADMVSVSPKGEAKA